MLQMGHSLQKWIVGDMPGWPSIETEISGHGGAILGDYPLSGTCGQRFPRSEAERFARRQPLVTKRFL
jgi:hypothetical protein